MDKMFNGRHSDNLRRNTAICMLSFRIPTMKPLD